MSIVMLGYDYSLTSRCVGFPLDDINVAYVAGRPVYATWLRVYLVLLHLDPGGTLLRTYLLIIVAWDVVARVNGELVTVESNKPS